MPTLRSVYRVSRRDKIIQETDTDALSSKYSAYRKKYLRDPYIETLVHHACQENANLARSFVDKLPLINRGTYVRNKSIDLLVDAFINAQSAGRKQIISLGAGSDTRPFHVLKKTQSVIYHELDFAVSTSRKLRAILGNQELVQIVGNNAAHDENELHSEIYHLHAVDLRTLNCDSALLKGMDPSVETLVISECCLCYMEQDQSAAVINWLTAHLDYGLGIILYEPIGKNDSFGQVMIHNLAQRGISLPTLTKYPTLESQIKRLQDHGFHYADSADIHHIHDTWLDEADRLRIDALEVLDEREEMNLLLEHYCVVWGATKESSFIESWAMR